MTGPDLRIVTPSRLHFGLLAWGEGHTRQFGSVGLMIDRPGIAVRTRPSRSWSAEGPLARRAETIIRGVVEKLEREGRPIVPLHLTIERASPEHVGLGTGTQLSLAVARLILAAAGEQEPTIERLAMLTGRGRRSGIGLHGFEQGGLLVDGGRGPKTIIPPLLARVDIPREWRILVVIPPLGTGLAGAGERDAFARLPAVSSRTVDRICRLTLLGLLPAAAERDLIAFGSALSEIQQEVGRGFSPIQGGLFADPRLEEVAKVMQTLGLEGVGQSSWGPALFGLFCEDQDRQAAVTRELRRRFHLEEAMILVTVAAKTGAQFEG